MKFYQEDKDRIVGYLVRVPYGKEKNIRAYLRRNHNIHTDWSLEVIMWMKEEGYIERVFPEDRSWPRYVRLVR